MKVRKRDGRKVKFDAERIRKAINAARSEVEVHDLFLVDEVTKNVVTQCRDGIGVEEIQDLVEKELMAYGQVQVAKAYILYRDKRTKARNSAADQIIADIVAAKKNDITRENANMNADTPAGMMMKISSESSRKYADDYLISEQAERLVRDNILHIHDKDYYPTKSLTCLQHPIDKILQGGFQAGHGESRPAKRIETASILSCISLETAQNEMHGGQAIPAFDFYMAPFVRATFIEELKKLETVNSVDLKDCYDMPMKDYTVQPLDMFEGRERYVQHAVNQTVSRVHQSMEAFIHNLNTIHSRGGNQVVFSSINYGTDTSAEGRCVMRELLLSTERGVGNGSTAIFPIQIWKKKRGVNYLPEDPNYDLYLLACRVTARRFFPNFVNLDAPFNQHEKWRADDSERYRYEVATMGCVDGNEVVTYSVDGQLFVESFQRMWNRLSDISSPKSASIEGYDVGEFIDLDGLNVEIVDRDQMVNCLRIIRNPDKGDWMKVTLDCGASLTCTSDHLWSLANGEVVETRQLSHHDKIEVTEPWLEFANVKQIQFIGYRNAPSYDVTTSSEHFNVSGIRSHNCRTRVFENRHGEKTSIARGNLSFSTINLPGIALSVRHIKNSDKRLEAFYAKLSEALNVMGEQLYDRYKFQSTALAKQFPLLMSGMWEGSETLKPTDEVAPVLKQGTLGMGFIGLAECLVALTGKHHGESPEAQALGLDIVNFMFERAKKFGEAKNMNYSVLATPAEGLSGKFTKKDRAKYGIVEGVTDKEYYTNSNHVPVYYKCSAAHKAKIEAPYHKLTRGGHIFYVELDGDATHNVKAVMDVVALMDKYEIGYGSINHNRNRCMECGYEDAQKDLKECPRCGSANLDRLQRITGYLVGTTDRWNNAKLAELNDRVAHE